VKETRLVCDWCPGPVKPDAIALLTLANGHGTRGALTRDLCRKCSKKAKKLFGRVRVGSTPPPPTPAGGAGKGRARGGEVGADVGGGASRRKHATHKGHERGRANRAKILAVVGKTPLKVREIVEKIGTKLPITTWYVKSMVREGQLKMLGRGSASKYVQP